MDRLEKYSYYIRNFILMLILFNIVFIYIKTPYLMFLYLFMVSIILINDYFRYSSFYNNDNHYIISMIVSILISAILANTAKGYVDFYFFSLLYEIIVYYQGKWSKRLLSLHIFLYLVSCLYKLDLKSLLIEDSVDILLGFSFYITITLLFFSLKVQKREKRKVQELNIELERKNKELNEYSLKVEKLAKLKERNRIAREIHDSLGHSLTALIMHLDYIEKVIDNDKEKAKNLIVRTQDLARESINSLRKAVFALKEDNIPTSLINSIEHIINNISVASKLNVEFNHSDDIEDIKPELKHTVFRIIQEGLTNSIKHGKASKIAINIIKLDDSINLTIEDNGIGCVNIVKGNGLTGLEERITALKGDIEYISQENMGFIVNVYIPLSKVIESTH